jgi:ABC-2 type transport system ATP-binding protein
VTDPRTSNAQALVEAEDLEVRYHGGPEPAVRGVSFRLAPGEGLMLSGRAGAGKTSVLRGLLGLVAHRGAVSLLGEPVGAPAVRGRIGYGPEGRAFAAELRVREVVRGAAALRGLPAPHEAARHAIARAGLQFVDDWRTSRLDAEGFRRLSLALGIVGDPDLVVLDDPWVLADTLREIAVARARGAAVLVAAERPAGLGPALGRRLVLAEGAPQ